MLTQIVRPMVRTQLRLLANSHATRSTLISTIAQWLSFLGVSAQVTQLDATSDKKIRVELTVGKPDACDAHDWSQILTNLGQPNSLSPTAPLTAITPQQESKLQRLLAYVIQVGNPDETLPWEQLYPLLKQMGFEDSTLLGIRSALKVPQSLDQLMHGLDADVAAIALPKAVTLALLDRKVNSSEDQALNILLDAMRQSTV